jgi:hypothetical protein
MANAIYNSFKRDLMLGDIDLAEDTIRLMLVTSSYTPNIDTQTNRSQITGEVVGTGYTSGGANLANKSVTISQSTDEAVFDANNVTFSNATITAMGAVIYKSTGSPDTDNLICYLDFGQNVTSTGGDFVVAFSNDGILRSGTI